MGGCLAWTLRRSDGTEYRMNRWTNPMPGAINSPAFVREDPEHIERCLASWFDMKKDWEENGPAGPFKHNMTDVYAPFPYGLAPSEYGLVVTDFVNKVILDCQHYSVLGQTSTTLFSQLSRGQMGDEDEADRLRELIDSGMARGIVVTAGNAVTRNLMLEIGAAPDPKAKRNDDFIRFALPLQDLEAEQWRDIHEVLALCAPDFTLADILLDMSPFTVERYDSDSLEDWRKMRRRVDELGFEVCPAEEERWRERFALMEELAAEDAEVDDD